MGCLLSRKNKVKNIYNSVWDLLDSDGDHNVSSEELSSVSKIIHQYQIECCEADLAQLKLRDPTEYVLGMIGKQEKDTLARKDFRKVAPLLPHTKWHNEILPILRSMEIQRLTDEQKRQKETV